MTRRLTALGWALATVALVWTPSAHASAFDGVLRAPSFSPGALAAEPTVSVADHSALEGSILRFAVSMPAPAPTDVRVTATTSSGTAGAADFTATTEEVEIPAGLTEAGFVVPTAEDALDEPAETITVTLSSPQGATIGDGSATGTIVDKSLVTVAAPAAVPDGGTLRFPVRLDHPAATEVTVRLATEDGTATAPGDYTAHADTAVVLPAGETEAFFDVVTAGDTLAELDETVTATIVGVEGPASLGGLSAAGTILDDDEPAVSIADASVLESFDLRFTLTLSASAPSPITVTAATSNGTATSPADFTAKTQAITIPAGQAQADFLVATADDALDEAAETLTVTLSDPQGAAIGDGTATGAIVDRSRVVVATPTAVMEGGTLRFPVRLDHPAATQVTVRLGTQDGSAQAPADYAAQADTTIVMPAGTTEAFFDVKTAEDFLHGEGDETMSARILGTAGPASPSLLSATGTIQDKPPPSVRVHPVSAIEGTPLRFPVRLSEPRPSEVTVTLTTQDGSAQAPGDYSPASETVRIPAGQTEAVFTVPTTGDGFDEPDETVTVRILRSTNAFPALLSATGTITDDDEPLPVVRIDAPTAVGEGSLLRFPLRLDKAAPGPVDIRLSTIDGTAKAPDDYTAQSLTLVRIPAGVTEAFLEVPTAEDELAESSESVRAEIKSTINVSPSVLSATGTIEDSAGPVQMLPGRVLGGRLLSGEVRVRPPRSGGYIDLGGGAGLPVGTQVDTTDGVLELVIPTGPRPVALPAGLRRARLSRGVFTIRRAKRSGAVTIELTGKELRRCGLRPKSARRLLADTTAKLRIKGRYAQSTSRNARWLTEDRCTSTRVKVSRGRVALRDSVRRKNTTVREGRIRTVRAR
jgi:hypothetical protein